MANIASFEGCQSVLSRWKRESVVILSEGSDKGTNLETSLHLSLSSPRMVSSPGALQLLGLLSLLPNGILDSDLTHSACAIPDIPHCKITLLRTSLAHLDGNRLKVLMPVREFIKKTYPRRPKSMSPGDLIQRLAANTGNIARVLRYRLENVNPDSSDLKDIVYGIFYFNCYSQNGIPMTLDYERKPSGADLSLDIPYSHLPTSNGLFQF
ncbi:hypothetical protein B0H14DRAFT_3698894 [Mycena olivaceomarginata]|nr:hypothetical protein B0H14DRAFT_3698894 [Mycena olivaceomarginata]